MDEKRLRSLDEHIAQALREAEKSGEIKQARDYGKPLDFGDGYEETPPELRLAFKALKDAGYAPPEIALLHEVAELRRQLEPLDPESPEAEALRRRINDIELKVSLRIERLASSRKL
jgi:hypothetical protein